MRNCLRAALLLALALPAVAWADCADVDPRCVSPGTWEVQLAVGAGVRTNPLADGEHIPLVLIPQVNYYGQRLFLDNLDLGYTLHESARLSLNLLVTPGSDGLYFFRSRLNRLVLDGGLGTVSSTPYFREQQPPPPDISADPLPDNDKFVPIPPSTPGTGSAWRPSQAPQPLTDTPGDPAALPALDKRRLTAMAGLEAQLRFERLELQLQLLQELTDRHQGQELRLALSSGTRWGQTDLGANLGVNWKSARLLDYYYGVAPHEAGADRPVYRPEAAWSPFVRFNLSHPLGERWRLMGSLQVEHLGRGLRASPLVDASEVMQIFVGGVYHF